MRGTMRSFWVEPEIRGSTRDYLRHGPLDLPSRFDVMARTTYGSIKAIAVDSDELMDFPVAQIEEAGVAVSVAPFLWEAMEVQADGHVDDVSKALAAWFESAFMPLESSGDQSIQGVAH